MVEQRSSTSLTWVRILLPLKMFKIIFIHNHFKKHRLARMFSNLTCSETPYFYTRVNSKLNLTDFNIILQINFSLHIYLFRLYSIIN